MIISWLAPHGIIPFMYMNPPMCLEEMEKHNKEQFGYAMQQLSQELSQDSLDGKPYDHSAFMSYTNFLHHFYDLVYSLQFFGPKNCTTKKHMKKFASHYQALKYLELVELPLNKWTDYPTGQYPMPRTLTTILCNFYYQSIHHMKLFQNFIPTFVRFYILDEDRIINECLMKGNHEEIWSVASIESNDNISIGLTDTDIFETESEES